MMAYEVLNEIIRDINAKHDETVFCMFDQFGYPKEEVIQLAKAGRILREIQGDLEQFVFDGEPMFKIRKSISHGDENMIYLNLEVILDDEEQEE